MQKMRGTFFVDDWDLGGMIVLDFQPTGRSSATWATSYDPGGMRCGEGPKRWISLAEDTAMRRGISKNLVLRSSVCFLVLSLAVRTVWGTEKTWQDTGDHLWHTADNWYPYGKPWVGDIARIGSAGGDTCLITQTGEKCQELRLGHEWGYIAALEIDGGALEMNLGSVGKPGTVTIFWKAYSIEKPEIASRPDQRSGFSPSRQ